MFIDSHIHLTHSLFEGTIPCIVGSKEMERIKYMDRLQMIKKFRDNDILLCIEPKIDLKLHYKTLEFEHFLKVVYNDDYENGALWIKVRKLKNKIRQFVWGDNSSLGFRFCICDCNTYLKNWQ